MQNDRPVSPDFAASAFESAIRTVSTEQAGLAALLDVLKSDTSGAFAQAAALMSSVTGRVIVTGVGKSGHVGAKIAATLASTGTPAFFVHPAEANHGDLGMITRNDAILAMSWSGESQELRGIVSYSRRFSIPLVALTSGGHSSLAREADVILLLPKAQEACPHGLAPTTSALLQLVMGDALAIALLEARGFTPDDFLGYHPGGKLGASLTHLSQIMRQGEDLPLVPVGTTMPEAVMELSKKKVGCVIVIDGNGLLAGIITDGDVARNLHRNLKDVSVEEIMTRTPRTVGADMSAGAAIAYLNENKIGALIVVDGERPVGVVHFHDLLRVGAV
jgi:arabinose-5-phosphate isomerase